jgi:hypothetical protein
MNLSAPKNVTWIVAVIIGLAGIAVDQGLFSVGSVSAYTLEMVAFVILALATWLKGL